MRWTSNCSKCSKRTNDTRRRKSVGLYHRFRLCLAKTLSGVCADGIICHMCAPLRVPIYQPSAQMDLVVSGKYWNWHHPEGHFHRNQPASISTIYALVHAARGVPTRTCARQKVGPNVAIFGDEKGTWGVDESII